MSQPSLWPELEIESGSGPVNVASVPQRSPFRYPGGKTWLVPLFRRWMRSIALRPRLLIEPFAGGGIISLTTAFEQLSEKVVFVEIDSQIAAVWETILSPDAEWLADRILSFDLSPESARAELAKRYTSQRQKAFQTILKNRTAHGGILAEGAGVLKAGENGKGIHSRWYPETIARRIRNISLVAKRLTFRQGDGFESISEFKDVPDAVHFIDPPYTAGGKRAGSRLYTHNAVDHQRLFALCAEIQGDFLMTYDNAAEVRDLAKRYGFDAKPVAMKNTHHANMTELLIGRDLRWVDAGGMFREEAASYQPKRNHRIAIKAVRSKRSSGKSLSIRKKSKKRGNA